jgi:hypothetical protein
MFVSVIHRISDPDRFAEMAASTEDKIPTDLRLPQYITSADRRTTVCLWEAPSVDRVRDFLEPLSQGICINEYAAVDVEASKGLPATEVV